MRIKAETPTWRIVAHIVLKFGFAAACLIAAMTENFGPALLFAVVVILGAIEDARDNLLDQLEGARIRLFRPIDEAPKFQPPVTTVAHGINPPPDGGSWHTPSSDKTAPVSDPGAPDVAQEVQR